MEKGKRNFSSRRADVNHVPLKTYVWIFAALWVNALCLLYALEKGPVNTGKNNLAVKGYDPVAYFLEDRPAKGLKDISFQWMGATWYFASQDNLGRFRRDPEKYAPQYGGYCAYAMASGELVDINPKAWKIVNDKLYLNYSRSVQRKWEKDLDGFIKKADPYWPAILKELLQKKK